MTKRAHVDRRTVAGPSVTSDDVLDAAMTLFAERGYHGTSLKQVAERLEIRTPSLYNHMDSKAELLRRIIMDTLHEVRSEFDQTLSAATTPREQLFETTYVYALHHARHSREALIVSQDTQHLPEPERSEAQGIRRAHERRFRQIIEEGAASGDFHVSSAKLASFSIREMCVSVARWYHPNGPLTPTEVATEYARQALRLVGAPD